MQLQTLLALIASYLFGGICAGYYLVKLRKNKDIRTLGSGSVGARNVGRELGKGAFFLVLALDLLKGAAVIICCKYWPLPELVVWLAGSAVVLGHIFPLQLGFKGGKGVATGCGALTVLNFPLSCLGICVFAICFLISRNLLLSAMAAFTLLPLLAFLLALELAEIAVLAVICSLILIAHRDNLKEKLGGK